MKRFFLSVSAILLVLSGSFSAAQESYTPETFPYDTVSFDALHFNDMPVYFSIEQLRESVEVNGSDWAPWECGSPFDWMDSSYVHDGITSYFSEQGSYISNGHMVLLYEGLLEKGVLLLSDRNIRLTGETTLEEFAAIFPVSYRGTEEMRQRHPDCCFDEYGDLQIHVFYSFLSEDGLVFSFRNGRLHSVLLRWLLC